MPVIEIIDHRELKYQNTYSAVVESAYNDNSLFVQPYLPYDTVEYDHISNVTISEILAWSSKFQNPVVLYLYDADLDRI